MPSPELDSNFYLNSVISEPPSRTSSPAPSYQAFPGDNNDQNSEDTDFEVSPGVLPDEVYDSTMSWWRAGLRRSLVRSLRTESRWLAIMQSKVRNKYFDAYFLYASSLGTHTFFMTLLPALFWFGYDQTGRGLVTILGMGVYWSSFLKDLLCAPRPFSPPVARLTIGQHHLEYGFPSTHTTNCISIVLYLHTLLLRVEDISPVVLHVAQAFLVIYAITIVYGRLYCGMHSLTDCIVGTAVGAAVWGTYWAIEDVVELWVVNSGWYAPITMISTAILMVNQHPQPVDDCPCFEDAIAFVASNLGVFLARWHSTHFNFLNAPPLPHWHIHPHSSVTLTLLFGLLKLLFGVLAVFSWRLFAKPLLGMVLPKVFRLLARVGIVDLSSDALHRRFYMPATEYGDVPMKRRGGRLGAIPSVIDLGMELRVHEGLKNTEGLRARGNGKARLVNGGDGENEKVEVEYGFEEEEVVQPVAREKHYDAEVLTKMIIYSGIGIIAAEVMPIVFGLLGW